jgi:hypothetical protein
MVTPEMLQKGAIQYNFGLRSSRRSDKINVEVANKNLLDCRQAFHKADLDAWLMYGTLLGAYRDKALIPWDRDTDMGFFMADLPLFNKAWPELKDKGFDIIRTTRSLFTIMREDEYIDFSLFMPHDGKHYVTHDALGPANIYKRHHFDVLDYLVIFDRAFRVPSDTEALFKMWYGENWREPQRNKWAYN